MKVQVLKTAGVSVTETKPQYDRKLKKAVEMVVGRTVYLAPGIHDVTKEQLEGLLKAGLCVLVEEDFVAEEVAAEEAVVKPVAEEAPKKKGKGKKPEAIDLGLD